jgi:hypothetical protein
MLGVKGFARDVLDIFLVARYPRLNDREGCGFGGHNHSALFGWWC